MKTQIQQLARSPIVHALLIAAGTALVWLWDDIASSPILWDHAYFTVLSQGIVRGQPIYSTSFMGYPPFALLVSAAAMAIGQWFDVPTYLAPRYLAVAIGIGAVVAMYSIVRRATGNAWAGIASAVVLGAFRDFSTSALKTLEPKLLVVSLGLFAGLALQRRSWLGAGILASLAASCWQPAGLIPLACGAVAVFEARSRPRGPDYPISTHPALRFAVGIAVGLLPALFYFGYTNAWLDFWTRAVVIPSQWQLPDAGTEPLRWLRMVSLRFSREIVFFVVAALSFAVFAFRGLAGWEGSRATAWLGARYGALPLLSLLWASFNSFDFQHIDDMLTIFPCVAFWVGLAIARGSVLLPATAGLRNASLALMVALMTIYGYADTVRRFSPTTLAAQRSLVDEILEGVAPGDAVFSFSAEAIYALSERPAASPYLRLTNAFMPFLQTVEPLGCRGLRERIARERPPVVVVGVWRNSSRCERKLPRRLLDSGYVLERKPTNTSPAKWWILRRR